MKFWIMMYKDVSKVHGRVILKSMITKTTRSLAVEIFEVWNIKFTKDTYIFCETNTALSESIFDEV